MPPPRRLAITSYCPSFSRMTNGSRISCWCTLFGKYPSRVRPFSLNTPVPGTRRTRTIASLRRPTVGADGDVTKSPESLCYLLDLEWLGELSLVRVFGSGVDLELLELLAAEGGLG